MKQKDIIFIISVAGVAAIFSFLIASRVFVTPKTRTQTAQKVDPIYSEMSVPDNRFFNQDSINPTRNSTVTGTNATPFNTTSQ